MAVAGERQILEDDGAIDLRASWVPIAAGFGDPTTVIGPDRVVRATRTPQGPASFELRRDGTRIVLEAFGPGADWVLERAADLVGLTSPPPPLPEHASERIHGLRAAAAGVRLVRTHRIVEALVVLVLQQLVRGKEAGRAHRNLVSAISEPAPGPFDGLMLPLASEQLRTLRPGALIAHGVLRKQAVTLRELGFHAATLEACTELPLADAERRLQRVRGLGPWTVGSLMVRVMGAADAVIVGDYHLPAFVAYNLSGETRADDARMLELLEPYRGLRGWATRWIGAAGKSPPRRGPRRSMRQIPGRPR